MECFIRIYRGSWLAGFFSRIPVDFGLASTVARAEIHGRALSRCRLKSDICTVSQNPPGWDVAGLKRFQEWFWRHRSILLQSVLDISSQRKVLNPRPQESRQARRQRALDSSSVSQTHKSKQLPFPIVGRRPPPQFWWEYHRDHKHDPKR